MSVLCKMLKWFVRLILVEIAVGKMSVLVTNISDGAELIAVFRFHCYQAGFLYCRKPSFLFCMMTNQARHNMSLDV